MKERLRKSLLILPVVSLVMTGCQSAEPVGEEVFESVEGTETIIAAEEGTSSEEKTDGVVSLTVWGAEEDQALMEQVIQSFEAEYAGQAEFDITFVAESESSCRDSLLNNVLEAPDVFTFADDQLMACVAAGVLKPVEDSEEIASRNLEASVEAASIEGELYAYPLTADNGYIMFYNKAYFSEEDIQSLDTMLAIAAENGKKITMDLTSGWYLYSFFGNTGMEVGLKEDGISNYCTWNSTEGNVKGVDVASSMLSIAQSPGFLCTGDDGLIKGAQDGSVIAGVSGAWNATAISEAWGEDYGAAKLPSYACNGTQVQMSSYAGYKLVGVNDYSKHKDWAVKFADWMTNEENQMLRFEMRGQGPANTNAAGSPEVAASPTIQAIMAQYEFASLQRIGTKYWEPAGTFGGTIAAGNPSNLELQDMMDTLVSGITESNSQ